MGDNGGGGGNGGTGGDSAGDPGDGGAAGEGGKGAGFFGNGSDGEDGEDGDQLGVPTVVGPSTGAQVLGFLQNLLEFLEVIQGIERVLGELDSPPYK